MGIRISTDNKPVKVWRNDRGQYIQISKKEGDAWVNDYQKVRFRGSPDIPNGTEVHIKDGFPALETWVKDGYEHRRIIWVIMDYDYPGMKEKPRQSFVEMPDYPDSFSIAEEELPF